MLWTSPHRVQEKAAWLSWAEFIYTLVFCSYELCKILWCWPLVFWDIQSQTCRCHHLKESLMTSDHRHRLEKLDLPQADTLLILQPWAANSFVSCLHHWGLDKRGSGRRSDFYCWRLFLQFLSDDKHHLTLLFAAYSGSQYHHSEESIHYLLVCVSRRSVMNCLWEKLGRETWRLLEVKLNLQGKRRE